MMHELELWPAASFVTLTYDDEHLPQRGTLLPRDLELWLKRVRRDIEPRRIRYYAAGEYGECFGRPHYHVIAYGLRPDSDREVTESNWRFGFTHVGYVTQDSIRYVADYVQAKLYGDEAERVYEGRVPPFARMSGGLGRDWCDARAEQLRESMRLDHRGVPVRLPRYYARRIGLTAGDGFEGRLEHALEVMRVHNERQPGQKGPWYDWESVRASCEQNEIDALARWQLFKRGKM